MSTTQTTLPPSEPAPVPRKKRGLFGFLFKSALGCTAFAIGALIALVLLLPSMLGGFAANLAGEKFGEMFKGSLEVADADLAWFGEQRLSGIVVRDPQKQVVARASAVLPSLWKLLTSDMERIGRVTLDVDADIVQDDVGVTNLQRALEPRNPAPEDTQKDPKRDDAGPSLVDRLARLDLDLRIASKRLSWSDPETRRLGIPFEVRDLVATVKAASGTPITVNAQGSVVSEQPGALVVDARIDGPIDARKSWPFGKVEAQARIEGFSTAMVDGIAGLKGNLVEVFGKQFTLAATVNGTSADSGQIVATLEGERGNVAFHGRLENGVLSSFGETAAQQGLIVTIPPPRGFLKTYVTPSLPAGTQLFVDESNEPWTVRAPSFSLPLPAMGASGKTTLMELLSKAKLQLTASMPTRIQIETAAARNVTVAASVRAVRVDVTLAPGAPAKAHAEAAIESGSPGSITIDVSADDPWTKLAAGALPPVDATVRAQNVSTGLIGALTGQHERIAGAMGSALDVQLDAVRFGVDGGTLKVAAMGRDAGGNVQRMALDASARVEGGLVRVDGSDVVRLRWMPAKEWVQQEVAAVLPQGMQLKLDPAAELVVVEARNVVIPLPKQGVDVEADRRARATADITVRLAGASVSNEALRAARKDVGVRALEASAKLAAGGALTATVRAGLQQGAATGSLAADVSAADAWAYTAQVQTAPLPVDARIVLAGLDTATLDALAGKEGLLAGLLGPSLDATVDARGASAEGGSITVSAKSEALTLTGSAHIAGSTIRCTGEEGLDIALAPRAGSLDAHVKSVLPAGTQLQLAPDAGPVTVKVREVAITLPKGDEAAAQSSAMQRLSQMALTLQANVPALAYSDASTAAAGRPITVRNLNVQAKLAPKELPFLRASGSVEGDPPGEIAVDVRALDPLESLAREGGADTWRAKIDVRASKLPTAIVDMLAGQGGLLVEALGSRVEMTLQAPEISMSKGAFVADLRSDLHQVHAEGHLAERTVVIDKHDGLTAQVGLGPVMSKKVVGRLLPTLVDVQKPQGAAPALFAVDALKFPLDGDLRKLDGTVRIDLGEITFGLGQFKEGLTGKLAAALGEAVPTGNWKVPAITIPIEKGVAGYQRLPIKIGSREYVFSGTYDMVTDAAQLSAQVPLKALGKKVSAELERLREYVDPETTVPITIKGSIRNPSVSLDNNALEKVLKDAAKKAIGKGLGGLLDDLKKKKD